MKPTRVEQVIFFRCWKWVINYRQLWQCERVFKANRIGTHTGGLANWNCEHDEGKKKIESQWILAGRIGILWCLWHTKQLMASCLYRLLSRWSHFFRAFRCVKYAAHKFPFIFPWISPCPLNVKDVSEADVSILINK